MNAAERRAELLRVLHSASAPVSAGALAERFGVSRQIIVGDVALLRAAGEAVSATPRGYVCAQEAAPALLRTVACVHTAEQTGEELRIFVDHGCCVQDVIVEHPVYGQLTGALDLRSRYDVEEFLRRSAGAAPLSSLTSGLHLHTLRCPDEASFARVRRALRERGFLFE